MARDRSGDFGKKNVTAYSEVGNGKKAGKKAASKKKASMLMGTDETINRYPGSYAKEASSPSVKSKHQDADIGKTDGNTHSRGLTHKGRKK